MSSSSLQINGMHCDACVRRVNAALAKTEGVLSSDVKIGRADVQFDESKVSPDQIAAAIEKIGFTASLQ